MGARKWEKGSGGEIAPKMARKWQRISVDGGAIGGPRVKRRRPVEPSGAEWGIEGGWVAHPAGASTTGGGGRRRRWEEEEEAALIGRGKRSGDDACVTSEERGGAGGWR